MSFRAGDKVTCVDSFGCQFIAKGQVYSVLNYVPHLEVVEITNNVGKVDSYSKTRFELVPSVEAKNDVKVGGLKYDDGKAPLALIDADWIEGVAAIMGFGAKKYAAHNWRKGLEVSRCLSAALRHIFKFIAGEDLDPESGLPHLDHAACCIMFARTMWKKRPELDDRHKEKHEND